MGVIFLPRHSPQRTRFGGPSPKQKPGLALGKGPALRVQARCEKIISERIFSLSFCR